MTKTRGIVLGGLLALGAGLAAWAFFGGSRSQSATLADGSRVRLRAVRHGTNWSYNFGNPLQRTAGKLSWKWAKDYAAKAVVPYAGDRTNLIVWVSSAEPLTRQEFRFVHDAGTNVMTAHYQPARRVPSGEVLGIVYIQAWPRRSRDFVLEACTREEVADGKPLWALRIRNPEYREYPQWKAEVLPVRRTVGDMTFTLEGLVEEVDRLPPAHRRVTASMPVEARLRITRDGGTADDWGALATIFRDATGNRSGIIGRPKARGLHGQRRVGTTFKLLPGEDACKLEVGFVRTKAIDTNDVFVLGGVSLSGTGPRSRYVQFTNVLVGRVQVGIVDRSRRRPAAIGTQTNVAEGFSVSVTSLEPRVRDISEAGARWFVSLEARDDLGRTFAFTNSPLYVSGSRSVNIPSDAKSVDIIIAAPRVVFVEYTVGRESITSREERR